MVPELPRRRLRHPPAGRLPPEPRMARAAARRSSRSTSTSFPSTTWRASRPKSTASASSPSVADALRLGGRKLAVDAVAVIGEHGNYPRTPRGNFMYPRRRYFDEITRVMRRGWARHPDVSGQVLRLRLDGCEGHVRSHARRCASPCSAARRCRLPGSGRRSISRAATRFTELLTTSYSDLEEHAYHAIELLQSMAERRAGRRDRRRARAPLRRR